MSNSLWPVDCSMPGFLVLHSLLVFAQTHIHWSGDVTQPSHPLLPPSPPALLYAPGVPPMWAPRGWGWLRWVSWEVRLALSPVGCQALPCVVTLAPLSDRAGSQGGKQESWRCCWTIGGPQNGSPSCSYPLVRLSSTANRFSPPRLL